MVYSKLLGYDCDSVNDMYWKSVNTEPPISKNPAKSIDFCTDIK
jgi:hypothetical protein